MGKELTRKALRAVLWSGLERIGRQGSQVVVQLLLARLLGPEAFGLVAMLAIFNMVAQVVVDSGFGNALIQKKEITQTDICSVFYLNVVGAVVMAGLLCLASPLIAGFYERPLLRPLTCFLSLTFVFNSLGLVQDTLLTREMDFRTQLKASVPSVLLSGGAAVALAFRGWGVWALAIQMVGQRFIYAVLLWVFSRWRPNWTFSWQSLRVMFGFGSRVLVSAILTVFFDNLYFLVIGKLFSAIALGLYANARRLQHFVSSNVSGIVSRVTFPVFSKVQDDKERLGRGLSYSLKVLVLGNSMVMFGLMVLARPLFVTILGDEWLASIPYFQLLCVSGLLYPLHVMNLNAIKGLGRSDLFLRLEIAKKVLIVANISITYRWGILAVIYGQIVLSVIAYFLNSYYSGKLLKYSAWRQLKDVLPYGLISGVSAVAMWAVGNAMAGSSLIIQMVCQILAGGVLWLALGRVLRLSAFMGTWSMLFGQRKEVSRS